MDKILYSYVSRFWIKNPTSVWVWTDVQPGGAPCHAVILEIKGEGYHYSIRVGEKFLDKPSAMKSAKVVFYRVIDWLNDKNDGSKLPLDGFGEIVIEEGLK